MENLILSFNVIAPLLLLLGLGMLLKSRLPDETVNVMNKILSTVFLPMLIFVNIYDTRNSITIMPNLFIFIFVAIICELVISVILCNIFQKNPKRRSVMIQGMVRSNYVIFGIPIAISIYGAGAASTAAIASILVIPLYNVIAVSVLTYYSSEKLSVKTLLIQVVKNPFIIASMLGLLFAFLKIEIPQFIYEPLSDVGQSASPLVFVFLGASFVFSDVKEHLPSLSFTVIMRLIVFPIISISIAILLGFRNEFLVILMTIFASPTAVSSYALAKSLGGDGKLAGNIVVFTSTLSILTMFVWIFVLKSLQFM